MLERTGSVVESTQLWWSVRPHHAFGTVEVRICDAQTRGEESFALAGLIAACIAQSALDYDERGYEAPGGRCADREIEENLWRAIRYGMSGEMIDFRARRAGDQTREVLERLLAWAEPARSRAGHRGRRCRSETAPSGFASARRRAPRSRTSIATRWPETTDRTYRDRCQRRRR